MPGYDWTCRVCAAATVRDTQVCSRCGFPSVASLAEIEAATKLHAARSESQSQLPDTHSLARRHACPTAWLLLIAMLMPVLSVLPFKMFTDSYDSFKLAVFLFVAAWVLSPVVALFGFFLGVGTTVTSLRTGKRWICSAVSGALCGIIVVWWSTTLFAKLLSIVLYAR